MSFAMCGVWVCVTRVYIHPPSEAVTDWRLRVNLCVCVLQDYLVKLLLIGDSGVGKSCLLLRFSDVYIPQKSEP